jgi:hypothetical protein
MKHLEIERSRRNMHWYKYVTIPGTATEIGLVMETFNASKNGPPPTYRGTFWPWDYDRNRRASYDEEGEWKSENVATPELAEMQVTQQFYYGLLATQHGRLYDTIETYQKYLSELPPHAFPPGDLMALSD